MTFSKNLSGINLLKMATAVLGLISSAVGIYSYLGSDWTRKDLYSICKSCSSENGSYKSYIVFRSEIYTFDVSCPKIGLEVFYIVTTVCGVIFSTTFIIISATLPKASGRKEFKYLDMAFHGIFCPLIIASACTFIFSAAKIGQLIETPDFTNCKEIERRNPTQFLTGGKIVAGMLSLKLGVLYGVVAFNILQVIRSGEDSYYYLMG